MSIIDQPDNCAVAITKLSEKVDKYTFTWVIRSPSFYTKYEDNEQQWLLYLYRNTRHDLHPFIYLLIGYIVEFDEYEYPICEIYLSMLNKNNIKVMSKELKIEIEYKDVTDVKYWRIRLDELESKINDLSADDTLKIYFEIKFIKLHKTLKRVKLYHDFENSLSTTKSNGNLEKLFLNKQFSDIKLKASCGIEFNAHKNILAMRSTTFAAMFEHDMLENKTNTVNIPDIEYLVLKEMLRFIYTDEIENIETLANKLFIAADKYDIEDLKSKCAKYIIKQMTLENAIEIFEFGVKYNSVQLKKQAVLLMKSNTNGIIKTDAFKERLQSLNEPFAEMILSLLE